MNKITHKEANRIAKVAHAKFKRQPANARPVSAAYYVSRALVSEGLQFSILWTATTNEADESSVSNLANWVREHANPHLTGSN